MRAASCAPGLAEPSLVAASRGPQQPPRPAPGPWAPLLRPASTPGFTLSGLRGQALRQRRHSSASKRPRCGAAWPAQQPLVLAATPSGQLGMPHLSPAASQYAPTVPRSIDMDPASMLLRQRIIFLGGQVDDLSADYVISQLLLLDAQDSSKDIKLFINSPGGSVTAGMGIYDAMKLCKAPVSTVCFGLAASMGAFLLCAGSKGKRLCMPNARVMIHQPLGGAGGSAIDVGLQVREMMYHKVKLTKIIARITGHSYDKVEEDTDRDYFMNAWEAVEYGICDAVIDSEKPGLVAPIGEAKEPPKTKVWEYWSIKEGKERRQLPGEGNLSTQSGQDGRGAEEESRGKEPAAV